MFFESECSRVDVENCCWFYDSGKFCKALEKTMSGHFDWTIFIYKQKILKRSNHWRKFRFSDCVATCRPMQVLHWAVAFFPFCVRRMTAATTVLDSFVESCRNDRVNEWMAAKSSSSSSLAQQFRLLKLLRRSCFSPRDDDEQQMNVDPFFFSLPSRPQKKKKNLECNSFEWVTCN